MIFASFTLLWTSLSLLYISSTIYLQLFKQDFSDRRLTFYDRDSFSKVVFVSPALHLGRIGGAVHPAGNGSVVSYGNARETNYQCIAQDKQVFNTPQLPAISPTAHTVYISTHYDKVPGNYTEQLVYKTIHYTHFHSPCHGSHSPSTGSKTASHLKQESISTAVATALNVSKHQISYNIVVWMVFMVIILILYASTAHLEEKWEKDDFLRQDQDTEIHYKKDNRNESMCNEVFCSGKSFMTKTRSRKKISFKQVRQDKSYHFIKKPRKKLM